MIFMRIGLPVVVFCSRKAGLPTGAWKDGARFSTLQAIVFSEAEYR